MELGSLGWAGLVGQPCHEQLEELAGAVQCSVPWAAPGNNWING